MLGGGFEDMLRCIRCGACMNHCPVYQAIGGHAYGWVYPGPMGAVLTPSLIGVAEGGRRGADGITNPLPGWGPGEQTTLARRIFSGGRAVDSGEDEPTPKLMIAETGGLSLISLKHVASRGPAGLPTSAFGPQRGRSR